MAKVSSKKAVKRPQRTDKASQAKADAEAAIGIPDLKAAVALLAEDVVSLRKEVERMRRRSLA